MNWIAKRDRQMEHGKHCGAKPAGQGMGRVAESPWRRARRAVSRHGRAAVRIWTVLAILIGLSAPLAAQDAAGQGQTPRPVKLVALNAESAPRTREFFGQVRARETVDLAFQVGGQIVEFPVVEGRSLEAGAMVAQLDLTPFRREVERAETELAKAERDLKRRQDLEGPAVSEVQVEDARTEAELARIAVAEARRRLDDATLETEFDALVARRIVANYTTVSAGQAVVRLHDMSELRVDIDVPEVLIRSASGGADVTFEASFPGSDASFPLALREFEAETAEVAQTYAITLAFTAEVPPWVLPGASVTVTATAPRGEDDAIVIPETALVFGPDRTPGVMVFQPDGTGDAGTVTRRQVAIEIRDDARVALTDGPEPGTEIVAAGAAQLRDGQTVRRFTGLGG